MSYSSKITKKELLVNLYKDPDRKSLYKIFKELIALTFYYRDVPRHYFSKFLFKKNIINIKDYFPNKFLGAQVKLYFNDYSIKEVLENKLFFDLFYSQFDLRLPQVFMYNHEKVFIIDNKRYRVDNILEFKELLSKIFNDNPLLDSIIVKKTYQSYGGDKIYKLDRFQLLDDESEFIDDLFSNIIKASFLFQKTIKQHAELDKLNPSCLNTIRFETFIDQKGEIDIISGFLRMSISNSHVDNVSQGGCLVGINILNGNLKKDGYTNFSHSGVKLLTTHPITKIKFDGFGIPFFEQAKNLVLKAAGYMPGLRLIGWDVGISESGPVLIEGNTWYNAHGNDIITGGYRTNPVFMKVLSEFKEKKK